MADPSEKVVGQGVDGDGDRQQQHGGVLVVDVDAVGVPGAEPLLGDRGDRVALAFDLVLVVDEVAMRLQVGTVVDVDLEAVAEVVDGFVGFIEKVSVTG